jgi:hypothetical protein
MSSANHYFIENITNLRMKTARRPARAEPAAGPVTGGTRLRLLGTALGGGAGGDVRVALRASKGDKDEAVARPTGDFFT